MTANKAHMLKRGLRSVRKRSGGRVVAAAVVLSMLLTRGRRLLLRSPTLCRVAELCLWAICWWAGAALRVAHTALLPFNRYPFLFTTRDRILAALRQLLKAMAPSAHAILFEAHDLKGIAHTVVLGPTSAEHTANAPVHDTTSDSTHAHTPHTHTTHAHTPHIRAHTCVDTKEVHTLDGGTEAEDACVGGAHTHTCVDGTDTHTCVDGPRAHACVDGTHTHTCVDGTGTHVCVDGPRAHACVDDTHTHTDVSFMGCSWLMAYHVGAAQELVEAGWVDPGTHTFAGSSSGSLVAAAVAAGVDLQDLRRLVYHMAEDSRRRLLGPVGVMTSYVHTGLQRLLPLDAAERVGKRLRVSVSRLQSPGSPWGPQVVNELVNTFENRQQLFDTLLASCYIPVYYEVPPVLRTGHTYVLGLDGGLTDNLPRARITVSPYAGSGADISPPAPAFPAIYSLLPPPTHELDRVYETGRRDARAYLAAQRRGSRDDSL